MGTCLLVFTGSYCRHGGLVEISAGAGGQHPGEHRSVCVCAGEAQPPRTKAKQATCGCHTDLSIPLRSSLDCK